MLLKYCSQYASKFGKLRSGHRTGKGQFSFQSQRKNVHTTAPLHSFHVLARSCSKSSNRQLPDVQAGFRKGRGTRDQTANTHWIIEKAREFQKNIYFCFIDCAKAFDCVDHSKLWKILQEMGITGHLTCLLRNCMQDRKQQLEPDMEQQTGSKSGKAYVKAVFCHPVYLTYIQSTSCEMPC